MSTLFDGVLRTEANEAGETYPETAPIVEVRKMIDEIGAILLSCYIKLT